MENLYVAQEDNENNNVDENSNDQQFHDYANIHQQYGHINYHHNEYEFQHQRADDEQAVRDNVYERFLNAGRRNNTDTVDRVSNLASEVEWRSRPTASPQAGNYTQSRPISEDFRRTTVSTSHIGLELPRCQEEMTGHTDHAYQTSLEIRTEAEELFNNFTIEQFRSQNVDTSHLGLETRSYLTNPQWAKAGQDLRQLADAFSKSRERNELRRKAHSVNMSEISMEDFFHLCAELFQGSGGITQERIVVLFTFVSDVAIQHVKIRAEQFIQRLLRWSLRFIFDRICGWVQQAGGWAVVLSTGTNLLFKVSLTVLASLGIVALGLYIVKTVKDL